ncbi:MAG: hypothetical protein U0640_07750 [Phycisphaerales bacterium]
MASIRAIKLSGFADTLMPNVMRAHLGKLVGEVDIGNSATSDAEP